MTRILYLAHDLDDPAIWRRVDMLRTGGAEVDVAGFQRSTAQLREKATVLGQTYNGRFLQRIGSVLRALGRANLWDGRPAPDAILARNMELLPLARRIRMRFTRSERPRLIYELLDVHRLLVGPGIVPRTLRAVERNLCRDVDKVLISSPRFEREHIRRYRQTDAPALLVENKVWDPKAADSVRPLSLRSRDPGDPIVIGWFGILRCAASLAALDALCRQEDGRIRAVLRGRPALDVLPDFHRIVNANPHMSFLGPYSYPDDLPQIYGEVDIAWLIDRYEAGANSDWLLPNRLYESGAHGAVPMALLGTETAEHLSRLGLGIVTPDLRPATLAAVLADMGEDGLRAAREAMAKTDPSLWRTTRQACAWLVDQMVDGKTAGRSTASLAIREQAEQVG